MTLTRRSPACGIVADDLTGATDSAVQFTRSGWQSRLAFAMPVADSARPGSVVAVLSDARALGSVAANAATEQAVVKLRDSGAEKLFLKIDSTMRGSVAHQIDGALTSWLKVHPDAVAVVCPSYPAMGRTVVDGHLYVNGQHVHETAIGIDPVTPVLTSNLSELVPDSVTVTLPNESVSKNLEMIDAALTKGTRIVIVDASTEDELTKLAETINAMGDRAIPVGSAGLAVAMSRVWSLGQHRSRQSHTKSERVFVVVSSLNEVSRLQSEHLVSRVADERILVLSPSLDVALSPTTIHTWVSNELRDQTDLPQIVLVSSPTTRPNSGSGEGATAAELIAESLAIVAEAVFDKGTVDAAVLVGGEGARTVLEHLGADSLVVRYAIREGTPLGVIDGGRANGLTVVTKAGGFGEPSSLLDIVSELLEKEG